MRSQVIVYTQNSQPIPHLQRKWGFERWRWRCKIKSLSKADPSTDKIAIGILKEILKYKSNGKQDNSDHQVIPQKQTSHGEENQVLRFQCWRLQMRLKIRSEPFKRCRISARISDSNRRPMSQLIFKGSYLKLIN